MSVTTTSTVKRGRPRTKSLTRLAKGLYESQDGRFVITGHGKRGRAQEFTVTDMALPASMREDESFVAHNLAEVVAVLREDAPESIGLVPESVN